MTYSPEKKCGEQLTTSWKDLDAMVLRSDKRNRHALNEDGMLVCNPRDREAAHRAQVEGIATERLAAVTCRKCLELAARHARNTVEAERLSGRPKRRTRRSNTE